MIEPQSQFQHIPLDLFEKEWRPILNSIFAQTTDYKQFFLNSAWKSILLPYGLYSQDNFEAIAQAAKEVGDYELIIKDAEILDPAEKLAIAMPWLYSAFDAVRCNTILNHFDFYLFGKSAKWGGISSVNDYLYIAGEQVFIGNLLKIFGGIETVRIRFFDFLKEEHIPRTSSMEKILRNIGWE